MSIRALRYEGAEWADDYGEVDWCDMWCTNDDCGLVQTVRTITQYGAVSLEREECEECGADLEAEDNF